MQNKLSPNQLADQVLCMQNIIIKKKPYR